MLKLFNKFLKEQNIDSENGPFLLAVSGGMDSVCMVSLFKKSGLNFAIAHCNFGLRGAESDDDEEFCRELAKTADVKIFVKKFSLKTDKSKNKSSIQLKARELRYDWFERIRKKHNFKIIATAHHLDDSAETMILNIAKGTGISGLHGILPLRNQLLRPLMFATREMLQKYAKDNKISWREDSSNSTNNYTRNEIRHNVLNPLKSIVPKAVDGFSKTAIQISKSENLLNELVLDFIKNNSIEKYKRISISMEKLNVFSDPVQMIYQWVKKLGFGITQIENVLASNNSNKKASAGEYELIKSRNELILVEKSELAGWKVVVKKKVNKIQTPTGEFTFEKLQKKEDNLNVNVFFADALLLKEKLLIRTWKSGDKISPVGMKGTKKISDLFTELKFDVWQKNNTPLFCIGNKVIWAVGLRVGREFEAKKESNEVVKIMYLPN